MRILIVWGEEEDLMNEIFPKEFTHSKVMYVKRLKWVLDKLKTIQS